MWLTPRRARAEQRGLRGASGGDGVQEGRLRGSYIRSPFRGKPGPFPSLRRMQARAGGGGEKGGLLPGGISGYSGGNLGKGRGPCPAPATAGSRAGEHATNGRQKRAARRRAGPGGLRAGGLPARSPWARKQRASPVGQRPPDPEPQNFPPGLQRLRSPRRSHPDREARAGRRPRTGDSLGGPAAPLDQVLQLALRGEKSER